MNLRINWYRNRERGTTNPEVRLIHDDLDRHDYEIAQVREGMERIESKQDATLNRQNYLLVAVVMLLLGVIGNIIVIVSVSR